MVLELLGWDVSSMPWAKIGTMYIVVALGVDLKWTVMY